MKTIRDRRKAESISEIQIYLPITCKYHTKKHNLKYVHFT